jgi:hypothetical protein
MNDEQLPDLKDCSDHDLLILIHTVVKGISTDMKDHECRIRSVEGNQIKILGAGALVGFVTGWLGKMFGGGIP